MNVLITGARTVFALDLVRRFGRHAHHVYVADTLRYPMASFSKHVRKTFRLIPPAENSSAFAEQLGQVLERWDIDLLIPTYEEALFISRHSHLFPKRCSLFVDDIEKLDRLHNKYEFSKMASGLGACAPETHLLRSGEDLDAFREDVDKWVFKPVYSRFSALALIRPKEGQLVQVAPSRANPWVAQRFIEGEEYSSYGIAVDGQLRSHSCYRSLYHLGNGSGIYFVNESHEQNAVREFVRQFVERHEYTGQIAFDFLLEASGQWWVIECNPRATSGLHMFSEDDPVERTFLHEQDACVIASCARPRMFGSAMNGYGFVEAVRKKRLSDYFRARRRAKDVIFRWNDPLPRLIQFLVVAETLAISRRHRIGTLQAATWGCDWQGQTPIS